MRQSEDGSSEKSSNRRHRTTRSTASLPGCDSAKPEKSRLGRSVKGKPSAGQRLGEKRQALVHPVIDSGYALSRCSRLHPVGDPSAIVANLRVAEFMEQGDRLLSPRSLEFSAVDDDLGGGIGKKLTRATEEG
jgi:hypothetical protein